MRSILPGLSLIGVVLLSACGGSSGTPTYNSFADIEDEGVALAQIIGPIAYTDPSTLPTSGSAIHDGFISAAFEGDTTVLGQMTLRTNFSDSTIAGEPNNFFGSDDTQYNGSLEIRNGTIDRTTDTSINFTFVADMNGRLTANDSEYNVDAFLLGDFTGPQHQYVEGLVGGSVTTDGQETFISGGEFVGELR